MKEKRPKRGSKSLKEGADMHSCDVLGSYTGVPEDESERPTQDADDL